LMSTAGVGEVYRDILQWGVTLPLWQQELLRRVLPERDLSNTDIQELAAAAVSESEQQPSVYSPLSEADLPSTASIEPATTLVSLSAVRSVNALRPDQCLTFGPQLTVIYGDNGSGKSGYARVLKKVYRARVVEDILSNLTSDQASADPSSATFSLRAADGTEAAVQWMDGAPVVNVGRFAVLDTACAGTYISGGALAVGPSGIDVPRRFTEELDRVKDHISSLMRAAAPNKAVLQRHENDTAAGRFIKGLSSAIPDSLVAEFETWTEQNAIDLTECESAIAAAKAQTPSARRTNLRSRQKALESIRARLVSWKTTVNDEAVESAQVAVATLDNAADAIRTVQALGDDDARSDFLEGKPWLQLLTAATQYVESLRQKASSHGTMSLDDRCALCWQPLTSDAQRRLQRFKEHLEGTAVKEQTMAADAVEARVAALRSLPTSLTPEDVAILEPTAAVHSIVDELVTTVNARRQAILALLTTRTTPRDLPPLDEGALDSIATLIEATKRDLAALPATDADAEAQLRTIERNALELKTRRSVADSIDAVRTFISTSRDRQRLAQAERSINTRAASLKASELHRKHMTARYAELVNEELRELRFRRRRPTLSQATNKGTVQVTPLVSAELAHVPADKVFSEGERTAIALACFLAELRLGEDPSGLIFDDPVSSLDHNVREHVARRLVAAAKNRQVVVFTHDLAFLADLREQADKIQDVDCEFRTLTATDYDAGFVEDEEPFGARSVSRRIKALKQLLVDVERAAKAGDMAAFRLHSKAFYERLRSTWERFIEERLFAKVVQRLERNVIAGALAKVTYTPELGEKAHEGWRRCSNALEAHDHAPAAGGQSYSVEEMKADFKLLQDVDAAIPAV
jgi:energy-coupling factor transporter ATP-binding protein EcfA2